MSAYRLAIRPAASSSAPNSFLLTFFCTLLHGAKCYPLSFHTNPNSFAQNTGVAYPPLPLVGRSQSEKLSPVTPFAAALADPLHPLENPATLSPVFAALTHFVTSKPFVCHSYKKHPGVAYACASSGNLIMEQFRSSHVITARTASMLHTQTVSLRRGCPVGNFLTC